MSTDPSRDASPATVPTAAAANPDYDLDETVTADTPAALKALTDTTRLEILDLLLDRAATITQLGTALGKPKGTIGYHVKVLESCGLIRVVRTEPVRALTARYYGRTGRTILISGPHSMEDPLFLIHDALSDVQIVPGDPLPMFTARRARIPESRALEYAARLAALAAEFVAEPRDGERVYGFVAGVYPTGLPMLHGEGDA